jgi:hypothetical protein
MSMQSTQTGGLWNKFSNNLTAQIIVTIVGVAVLIAIAAEYIW